MSPHRRWNRRELLKLATASGLAGIAPLSWLRAASSWPRGTGDRRLVLLFLDGGNDGLNTLVPIDDDRYQRARPRLGIRADDAPRVDAVTALHPALAPWKGLLDEGWWCALRDVGYDRPDRSHFVSRDIWHSGRRATDAHETGWIARAAAAARYEGLPPVAVGAAEAPLLLHGARGAGLTIGGLDAFRLNIPEDQRAERMDALRVGATPPAMESNDDATPSLPLGSRIARVAGDTYRTVERLRAAVEKVPAGQGYPESALADRLRLVARFVRAEEGPPAYWLSLGGYDTHAVQSGTHAALHTQVAQATNAFVRDLARDGAHERVLLLVYSEFGRRVRENGSLGTDHGAAGPVFALGGGVRAGLHGTPTDFDALLDGDVRPQQDFRSVFGEAVADWMGWPVEGLFDGAYADGLARAGFLA